MADHKKKFYAYCINNGEEAGVVETWGECEEKVRGKSARYRGFPTVAGAEAWIAGGAKYEQKAVPESFEPGIYFDAGTGRGNGVEVRITNEAGESLVKEIVDHNRVNEFGNILLPQGATNNYGELLGCKYALMLAIREGKKKVFGDSKLIIDFWSKGYIKKETVAEDTVALSDDVKSLRFAFEKNGGKIAHISGDWNPADLGFHK